MKAPKKTERLVWCTDIHLDHCKDIPMFIDDVLTMQPDRVVVTGDISNAEHIVQHLTIMAEQWKVPVDFVLGNHDYYGKSKFLPEKMKNVIEKVGDVVDRIDNLNWLSRSGPVRLSDKTALVGNGLWCDWRAGFKDKTTVWLNDYILIEDLLAMPYSQGEIRKTRNRVQNLAKDRTNQLMKHFKEALDQGYENIIVGVHVPPFHQGSFYNGVVQDDDWAPHFVCKVAGDRLKEETEKHPDVKVTVLCGHTHGKGEADILPNLHVINGPATYRHPAPQIPIIVE